jgi:hypothetical protein
MNQKQARKIVWSRMATTAMCDGESNNDWMLDESEDPKDHARLEDACRHVSDVCQRYAQKTKRV